MSRSDKSPSAVDKIRRGQAAINRENLRFASLYAGHRAHLTKLLQQLAPARPAKLCLLGAGNAYDVDLDALAHTYAEVHLVDFDPDALAGAHDRAATETGPKLHRHAPVDLMGALPLPRWRSTPPSLPVLMAEVQAAVERITGRLPGPYDVTASCCMLTQLFWAAAELLGREHPALDDLQQAVALIHWRTLAALTAPGGTALLATDVVSNETYPLDTLDATADLTAVIAQLAQTGNHFRGGDPSLPLRLWRGDNVLRASLARPTGTGPWLWQATEDRMFLVQAWKATRA